jgi:hypothetical protein
VASFVAEHLKGRAEVRKQAIERALKAAATRATSLSLLKAPPELVSTASGVGPTASPFAQTVGYTPAGSKPLMHTQVSKQTTAGLAPPPEMAQGTLPDANAGTLGSTELQVSKPFTRSPAAPLIATLVAGIALVGMASASVVIFKHKQRAALVEPAPIRSAPAHRDDIPPPVETAPPQPEPVQDQDAAVASAAPAASPTPSPPVVTNAKRPGGLRPTFRGPTQPAPTPPVGQPAAAPKPSPKKDEYGF